MKGDGAIVGSPVDRLFGPNISSIIGSNHLRYSMLEIDFADDQRFMRAHYRACGQIIYRK
jgi:hypothetical protein